uniref:NADH dehydrogenase subunit 6 n=1 Tax=Onchidella celtica TaxID=36933 RepID=Q6VAQ6_9EUPU|nr:NADH dehydrogenase subunit 6 [Onchidella celtica]AAR21545.2 NADH dehydrogenase subunit 6 [Onchidella celtica]
MNLALIVFLLTFCLMMMFPVMGSPLSLGGTLVLVSFALVSVVALISSTWYGYILFLVYVGGLLVLFIYVCMVSSNYPFTVNPSLMASAMAAGLLAMLLAPWSLPWRVLGSSVSESGVELPLFLLMALVTILLAAFLATARIVLGPGSIKIESRK